MWEPLFSFDDEDIIKRWDRHIVPTESNNLKQHRVLYQNPRGPNMCQVNFTIISQCFCPCPYVDDSPPGKDENKNTNAGIDSIPFSYFGNHPIGTPYNHCREHNEEVRFFIKLFFCTWRCDGFTRGWSQRCHGVLTIITLFRMGTPNLILPKIVVADKPKMTYSAFRYPVSLSQCTVLWDHKFLGKRSHSVPIVDKLNNKWNKTQIVLTFERYLEGYLLKD